MASAIRGSSCSLEEILQVDCGEFDFFQAVRLIHIETIRASVADGAGLRVTTGHDQHPLLECVRFRAHVALAFPPAEIANIAVRRQDGTAYPRKYEISTTFMGLVGAMGVLPQHYTQLMLRRLREKDEAFRNFLDLFHHRIISIYYRAWQRSHVQFQWEESRLQQGQVQEDRFTQTLYSFTGFANGAMLGSGRISSSTRSRLEFSDQLLLYYSGIFAQRPRNAVSLQRLLSSIFAIPVEVRQHQGQWVHLSPEDQTRMPGKNVSQFRSNSRLGESAMAGDRVWSVESKIRIVAGPVRLVDFNRFCPGHSAFNMLSQIVRIWVGPDFDVDLQVILLKEEAPRTTLKADGDCGLLGWTSWIGSKKAQTDCREAVFRIQGDARNTTS